MMKMSKVLSVLLIVAMLAGMAFTVSAAQYTTLYESSVHRTNSFTSDIVTGAGYEVEGTIYIPSLAAKDGSGNMRGVKFVLGQLSDGCNIELWLGKEEVQVNESGWHSLLPHDSKPHNLSNLEGRDLPFKITVESGTAKLYLDGAEVYSYANAALEPVSTSKFAMDQWDSGFTLKYIKISGTGTGSSGSQTPGNYSVLYQSNNSVENSVVPNVVTGNQYEVEVTINIKKLTTGEKGVKLVAGQCSGQDIELWLRADGFQLNNWGAGIMHNASHSVSNLVGRDVALKFVVNGGNYTLYIDGVETFSYYNAALIANAESKFSMDQWESGFTMKSITIRGIATQQQPQQPNLPAVPGNYSVLYETTTSVQNHVEPNVVTGSAYVMEATFNLRELTSGGQGGLKLVAGQMSSGANIEVWIRDVDVQINDSLWSTNVSEKQDHGMTGLTNRDLHVVLIADNGTYSVYLDGVKVFTYTNEIFKVTETSKLSVDQWNSGFTMSSMKISGIPYNNQGGNTGNEGGNTGNQGGNTGNEGGNTGNEGGNTGNQGGNTGNEGGNTGNEGGNTDNEGGNTGNQGGNTGNEGGNTGNQGGNTGNEGGNTGNEGGNTGNQGGNTGNQGGNTGNQGGNTGNQGDNTGNNDATEPTEDETQPTEDATQPTDGGDETTGATQPADDETKAPAATDPKPQKPGNQNNSNQTGKVILVIVVVAVVCLGGIAAATFILLKKNVIRLEGLSKPAAEVPAPESNEEPASSETDEA